MSLDAKRLCIEQLAYFEGVSDAEVILTGSPLRLINSVRSAMGGAGIDPEYEAQNADKELAGGQ